MGGSKLDKLYGRQVRKDILAGITTGVVALPLALAFGYTSGLGAIAGLYGAIAVGLFAAIFGGTPTQISGPTGPMTVVAATIVAGFASSPGIIVAIFLLAGLFQIILGIFNIGQYIKYIPYPIVSGFMSGIGLIIILLQIYPLLGLPPSPKVQEELYKIGDAISLANLQAVMLTFITIAVIYVSPKLFKYIPATLIALVVGTGISVFFGLNIPKIGDIPVGLPTLKMPTFTLELLDNIMLPALTLAILGAIDSLLTAIVADKLTKSRHNSKKELIGQGIGNVFSAIIGGLPGAGATMRTVVNINAGGKTRISGVVHSLLLLAVLLGLGPLASQIPMAVLAGILITVGISIIDYRGLKDITKVPKSDAFVQMVVLLMTVFIDLLQAVGAGMILASIFFVKRMGDIITRFSQENLFHITWNKKEETVILKRLTGPLFFGFSNTLEEQIAKISKGKLKAMILDMTEVPHIDQSGLYAMEEIAGKLDEKNVSFILVIEQEQPKEIIENARFLSESTVVVHSIQEAILLLREHLGEEEKGVLPEYISPRNLQAEKI